MIGLLVIGLAQAQDDVPFGCSASPFPGTVQEAVVAQARETNAQLYGAASFAERVLFPRIQQQVANDVKSFVWASEVGTMAGVAYVPSHEIGADCDIGDRNHRVDLFGSSTGMALNLGRVQLYYAGSLTGHLYAKRVVSGFVPYGYALGTALGGPFVTVPTTYLGRVSDDGTSSLAGDYFLGVHADLELAYASAAYIGSTGGFLNVTGKPVRLFVSAAIGLDGVPYVKSGMDRQKTYEPAGFTSAFVRSQSFEAPPVDDQPGGSTPFRTAHFDQTDIAHVLDLHFAYAVTPEPLVHDLRIGLHTPVYGLGKQILGEGEGFYAFEDMTRGKGILGVPISLEAGQVELPPLPYYGQPGGKYIHLRLEAFMIFPGSNTGGTLLMYTFKVNDPETLAAFPYAVDALTHYLSIQIF
ncbi:MAG: hypothetical protein KC621_20455 [Myxococcales bacterium]|nr:hypothetical protein [Myxococcales bacterium]